MALKYNLTKDFKDLIVTNLSVDKLQTVMPGRTFILIANLTVMLLLTGCWASLGTTIVSTFTSAYAQNVLSSASQNYSPKYANEMDELFANIFDEKKIEKYITDLGEDSEDDTNKQQLAENEQDDDWTNTQPDGTESQDFANSASSWDQTENPVASNMQPANFQTTEMPPATPYTEEAISMDVAILAQRASESSDMPPLPIDDGDILKHVPGNPLEGDKIKVTFTANCDCYVYVVGIDGTGFAAQIFPDEASNMQNPVQNGREYMVPGDNEWYGLDDVVGVENIYFIASHNRRLDLERIIKKLVVQERVIKKDYQPVQLAAAPSQIRGLVKVSTGPTSFVQSSSGETHSYTPTTFTSNVANADLVVARWFKHE